MVENAQETLGTREYGVNRSKLLGTICRHHATRLDINVAAPIKRLPVGSESEALSCRFQHTDAFWHHLFPDAVACDDCNIESFHGCQTTPSRLTATVKAR